MIDVEIDISEGSSWAGSGFRHHPDLLREGDEARVVLVGAQETDNYAPTPRRLREKDREEHNVVDIRRRKDNSSSYQRRRHEPLHLTNLEKRDQFVQPLPIALAQRS